VPVEKVDGLPDLGRRDDVPGAGQHGDLPVGELPVGGDRVVERAVVVAIADEDERRCGDLCEVLECVARGGLVVRWNARRRYWAQCPSPCPPSWSALSSSNIGLICSLRVIICANAVGSASVAVGLPPSSWRTIAKLGACGLNMS
jgi:hypothetical protein